MRQVEDKHWWFINRRRLAMALIDQRLGSDPEALILDIGCGTGGNLAALAGRGQAVGMDLSAAAIQLAHRRRLPRLLQASALALPYPANQFALVTAFDVLYHRWITDDHLALAEIYRVTQPGGWLLLTDSAMPVLWSTHDEIYYARQRYTLSDIRDKLHQAGFEVQFYSYRNTLLFPLFLLVRLVMNYLPFAGNLGEQLPANWLNQGLIQVGDLENRWLRQGRTWPIGSSLICLSQKPLNVCHNKSYVAAGSAQGSGPRRAQTQREPELRHSQS
jgi:ubiquinone/menaquinone biosynthesis C-methylase UbiE